MVTIDAVSVGLRTVVPCAIAARQPETVDIVLLVMIIMGRMAG
jgi:hypothetical protein